jgi:hypothetical protein
MYKTKTQKKNALKSIQQKSKKLFLSGILTIKQQMAVEQMVRDGMKKL